MRTLSAVFIILSFVVIPLWAQDVDDPRRDEALAEFDDTVNGSTTLVDTMPPVDREEMIREHREDEAAEMDDELAEIDGAMWYGYAKKEGWLNQN